ncbi:alkaline phosphatase PafA [Ferruginibacter sp. SUN002]|uniref:alkaline phosphatase PafA n=1 Tax=Ferruginibacter sp. SUN002 TaxID=2937789 RepID=UPI003D370157
MMRRSYFLITCFLLLISYSVTAQSSKPKLVVGLVIDQMRWDYLYRYNNLYSANGFKRLLKEGFSAENTLIPYTPTYTAPGHTSVYTGSVPAVHGIVGNNWYDRTLGKNVYCTDDSTVSTVGSNTNAGKMSPDNMWTTTITDELRLSNNFKTKVIGIALKDRGAILPAGHSANAAYWYDDKVGKWITSSYYMKQLPTWVDTFNNKDLAAKYMSKDWNTLLPIEKYDQSTDDDEPYEDKIEGLKASTFPHKLSSLTDTKYQAFKRTPFGTTYTFDFAKATIQNEDMGSHAGTDFLAVSISSTDYIGHAFGPNSIEAEDAFLRLDKDIENFLLYLDTKIGKGNYMLFLTADHGAAHAPGFLAQHQIPGGMFEDKDLQKEMNDMIERNFGVKNGVVNLQNYQVYLNTTEIEKQGKDIDAIKKAVIKSLKQKVYIVEAFELDELSETTIAEPQKSMMTNGYNPKRSGDIQFTLRSGYFDGWGKGTTHGLWNPYDAHIPLLFFGWGVKPGKTNRETYMTDIAATVAAMLKIQMPSGCVGKVITEAVK